MKEEPGAYSLAEMRLRGVEPPRACSAHKALNLVVGGQLRSEWACSSPFRCSQVTSLWLTLAPQLAPQDEPCDQRSASRLRNSRGENTGISAARPRRCLSPETSAADCDEARAMR